MDATRVSDPRLITPPPGSSLWAMLARTAAIGRWLPIARTSFLPLATVFIAYVIAGELGQATTKIRSGNLGPVWPAYGIALAGFLRYGYRVWPAIATSAFLVAYLSPVPALTAAGQAAGATLGAATGTLLLRRIARFDPALRRLRDALGLIVLGGVVSPLISATIGMFSLYAAGLQAYSGLGSAWLIYWLGDGTGVLLVTPLVFTLRNLWDIRSPRRIAELAALGVLLTAACVLVFGDLPFLAVRPHVLALAVLPFVMWGAIGFGIAGAALSVFLIATIATVLTALGLGPFAGPSPFVNAALLDVLFAVLSVSGLTLAAVIAERERAEAEREQLVRERIAAEARLRLTAIVESSNDAILSVNPDGVIQSWNAAAQRIFGYTEAEVIGQPSTMLIPPEALDDEAKMFQRLKAGERVETYETIRVGKEGTPVDVSVTLSALTDAEGRLTGASTILRDITSQKQAEAALTGLNRKLILAQEQERSRLARELHDDIGQRLALLSFGLTGVAQGLTDSPQFRDQVLELEKQSTTIAADLQALSHGLHSSKLELLGLGTAMRSFCEEFSRQQQVRVHFKVHDLAESLPHYISLSLFRVLQEALHNSAKHSGAEHVEVDLWGLHGVVHLRVRDHGVGFNVEASKLGQGLGLASMEERLKLVDGELAIESQPNRGTTIDARVRLSESPSTSVDDAPPRAQADSPGMYN